MKASEHLRQLNEERDIILEITKQYPDLEVNDYSDYLYIAKSVNSQATHFVVKGYYVCFFTPFVVEGQLKKIYSDPPNFGCYSDEWYHCQVWVDEAMEASIPPNLILKALNKINPGHAQTEYFIEKFKSYPQKFLELQKT